MSDFGPSLPPGVQLEQSRLDDCDETSSGRESNGKKIVQGNIIGPALPPHLACRPLNEQCNGKEEAEENTSAGTVGVGHVKSQFSETTAERLNSPGDGEENAIGPSLPSHLRDTKTSSSSDKYIIEDSDDGNDCFGPSIPPEVGKAALPNSGQSVLKGCSGNDEDSDDEDDEIIGPVLPPSLGTQSLSHSERIAEEFDARSKAMKDKLLGIDKSDDDTPIQRESWMLTLPSKRLPNEQKGAGLKARTFSKSTAPTNPSDDDASIWTDTPADRARKEREQESGSSRKVHAPNEQDTALYLRDQKMAKEAERLKTKRGTDSLLDIHKKKKEKETTGPKERRPFDREKDLQIPSSLGKSSDFVTKSKGFQSRFSSGQQKFL